MRQLLLFLTFFFTVTFTHGQTQFHLRYGSSYRDGANKVIQTQDGNFLIAGHTFGFGSAGNALIMKVNPSGTVLWIKDYSGINFDEINDLIELPDKKLVMCGSTESFGAGYSDAFVIKTDSLGNLIWAKTYGDIGPDFFSRISTDGLGGFYAAGVGNEFTNGFISSILLRLDGLGNVLWSKAVNDWISAGGDWDGIGMTALASGEVILAENVYPNTSFSLYKFSSSGTLVWSNNYFPTPTGSGLNGLSIIENGSGEILVNYSLANVNTVAQALDNFVIKLNSNGTVVWNKSYGGTYSDYCRTIANTNDGGTILFGITNSAGNGDEDACLIKIQSNGSLQWAKTYGTAWADRILDGIQTSDNGFVFTGQTWPVGSDYDSSKIYLVKTDTAGNTSCNNISWNVTTVNQTVSINTALPPVNITFQESEINWSLNSRYLYTADICNPASVFSIYNTDNWSIFPNPFSTLTTLQTDSFLHNATLTVDNCFGQTVKHIKNISGQTIILSRDNLVSGLYFIRLTQDNKIIFTDKLVITD